jgi:DNA-binding PadR family transcriptional regulator
MSMSRATPDPASFLPLSEAVLQILLTLADEPRHGYGIMGEVEERTDGRVRLGPGTLYGALKRLREDGVIDEVEQADGGGSRRKRLVPEGGLG